MDFLRDFLPVFNDILFWIFLYILLWQAYILLFNRGVPNIGTAPAIREKMIALLKKDKEEKGGKNYIIIDTGAGNGRLTREIAKAIPDARVIGVEIAILSFLKANFWKRFYGVPNVEYKKADFFKYDLSEADAVVFYLTAYEMGRMGEKLKENLKPGTLVLSNRFKLRAGWVPVEEYEQKTSYPHQRELYVYRKT